LEVLLEEYDQSHPELTIETLAVAYDSYANKLEAAIPRNNGPDVFIYAHEKIGSWSGAGIIAPLEISNTELAEFHPTTQKALQYEGEIYGIPLTYKCLAMFQNTDLLKETPKTTDELFALRSKLAEDIVPLAYPATEAYFHMPWLHGFGGSLFDEDGNATLNHEGSIASLHFLQRLEEEKLIPKEPTTALVSQLFNQGKAALVINGPWFLSSINEDINYEIHPLPIVSETGLSAAPFLSVEGAFLSAYSTHPTESVALAKFLGTTESAVHRAVKGRQTVATLEAYDNPKISDDPIIMAFRRQLEQTTPTPNTPQMSATWEPMARAVRRVNRGAMSPEVALAGAQTEFEIFTRPPPPEANPIPYLVFLGLGILSVFGYLGWQFKKNSVAIKRNKFAYLYVAPAAIAMTLLTAIPFVVGATVSLFAHHQGSFTFVGLANFANIIFATDWAPTSPLSFYYTLAVTVLWTVSNLILHVGIGLSLALLLREPWLKLKGVYRALLIIPWAIPNYITALIWKGLFHQQFGAINAILVALGLPAVSWFGQFSTAFAANLITNTWLGFPFMMVVSLGALQSIPRELEQAASIDGASAWQRFWYITLPLLKPTLLPAVVLGSVWTFNMFNIIYLVSGGEPDSSTDILISDAYRWAFTRGHRYGYASAYAVLIFIILLGYAKLGNKIAGKKTI
jgi:arabinogalactan oligomer/maltooligosaccharide transport system permease protein